MQEIVVTSEEHGWTGIDRLIGHPVRVYLIYSGLIEGVLHSVGTVVTIRHSTGFTQLPLTLVRIILGVVET